MAARQNSIWMGPGSENQPQTVEGFVSIAVKPGTLVTRAASGVLTATGATLGAVDKYYILNEGSLDGLGEDLDTLVGTDTTAEAFDILDGVNYSVLLANAVNITALDTPLTIGTANQLVIGTPGTHEILFYSSEIYNNNSGSPQLLKVRKA